MRRFSRWVVLLAAAALTACAQTMPILNVDNAAVVSPAGKPLSNEQVKLAIVRAGSALGWAMKDAGPNKLAGTLILRTHTANIEITYSPSAYSIAYKSSIDLMEANGKIHKNYNGWIMNLNKGIGTQLALAT